MPCYKPLTGRYSLKENPTGKHSIVFGRGPLQIPCGRCIGCRLERSRQWAIRCVHESSLYDENCFITLTYSKEPEGGTLVKKDFQDFMKRLRIECARGFDYVDRITGDIKHYQKSEGIRFFHCGEYGSKLSRPHYHACIFGFDFPDKLFWSERQGVKLYRSATLERLWTAGYSIIGDVTFESAAYVARYVVKKITGKPAAAHYAGRLPEYTTMSRRPGIGFNWFKNYAGDVFPGDFVVVRGNVKCKPPKYYEAIYDIDNHVALDTIKAERRKRAESNPDNSFARLRVRGKLKAIQLTQLHRGYENGITDI